MTLQACQQQLQRRWVQLRLDWHTYQAVIRLLARQHELHQLVRWAERKRLAGPQFHYTRLLHDTERALWRKRSQAPWAASWALNLYRLSCLVFPEKTTHRKGSARKFRRRWATV